MTTVFLRHVLTSEYRPFAATTRKQYFRGMTRENTIRCQTDCIATQYSRRPKRKKRPATLYQQLRYQQVRRCETIVRIRRVYGNGNRRITRRAFAETRVRCVCDTGGTSVRTRCAPGARVGHTAVWRRR